MKLAVSSVKQQTNEQHYMSTWHCFQHFRSFQPITQHDFNPVVSTKSIDLCILILGLYGPPKPISQAVQNKQCGLSQKFWCSGNTRFLYEIGFGGPYGPRIKMHMSMLLVGTTGLNVSCPSDYFWVYVPMIGSQQVNCQGM